MTIKNNFIRFIKGFKYAFSGIVSCIKSERNMRVHLCAAFYVIVLMRFYHLSDYEKGLVFLTIGSVIAFEIINTAIETAINLCSPDYHSLAKKAKDAAAGAVLCSAIFAVIIGVEVFWDINIFKDIYTYYLKHISAFIGFIVSIVLWVLFIFVCPTTNNEDK